ncbi:hypothetical protein QQ045_032593 [Rhodiola kirilowii]
MCFRPSRLDMDVLFLTCGGVVHSSWTCCIMQILMATDAAKNLKKANLLDHNSIKHLLDESVTEVVTSRGYKENVRLSNIKMLLGLVIIAIALVAQFYWKKFPENKNFLIGCIISYPLIFMTNFTCLLIFFSMVIFGLLGVQLLIMFINTIKLIRVHIFFQ